MSRPFAIKRSTKSSDSFARGRTAISICQRSGFKKPYREMVFERGTNTWVHRDEDDEQWNVVEHPQNYPPEKLTERIALRWAHPDNFDFDISGVVSADQIWLVSITSVNTFVCIGTGTSVVPGLHFNYGVNSQYIILISPGI